MAGVPPIVEGKVVFEATFMGSLERLGAAIRLNPVGLELDPLPIAFGHLCRPFPHIHHDVGLEVVVRPPTAL